MFLVISFQTTLLDQVKLDASFVCPKCQSQSWLLNTEEVTASLLWVVKAKVVCEGCGKKISKKYWNSELRQLVASKETEFKPSFMKRFGLIIISISLFLGLMSYAVIDSVLDHNKVVKNAKENFAKAYGDDAKKMWLETIQIGDFVLCNKDYHAPAIVFQVKEVKPDVVVLTQFEQTVPRTDFEEIDKLNQLTLGTGESHDIEVSRRNFNRNIIELDDDSRNNLRIQQIRKRSK